MTKRITHKICKNCKRVFKYTHRKQMFCDAVCSFFYKLDNANNLDDCFVWVGSKHTFGYGDFRFNGKYYRAHVFSFDLFIGGRKKGDQVLHECDNPSCCNPRHLFLGDQAANMDDMARKERSGQRKLTNAQVIEIKKFIKSGATQAYIASIFNVTREAISAIKTGKNHINVK